MVVGGVRVHCKHGQVRIRMGESRFRQCLPWSVTSDFARLDMKFFDQAIETSAADTEDFRGA